MKSCNPHANRSGLVFSFKFWILTILLIAVYSTVLFAQNTVYVDPGNSGDPAQDGTIDHPFAFWSSVEIESNTIYLQKRGTTALLDNNILIRNKDYVTISAYGDGAKPIISRAGNVTQAVRIDQGSKGTVIDGIYFFGEEDYSMSFGRAIYVEADVAGTGEWVESLIIKNCHIAYHQNALIIQKAQTGLDTLLVENCLIHDIKQEGLWGAVTNPTVRNCHLYNINMDWHFIGHTHSQSGGDAIQFGPGNAGDIGGTVVIENNIVDRRETGNKFCFIYASGGSQPGSRPGIFNVYVRYNTFYPPKDTADDQGGTALYIVDADSLFVYGNYFSGHGYDAGSQPQDAAFISYAYVDARYNIFDRIDYWVNLNGNDLPSNYYNNVFNDIAAGAQAMIKTFHVPPSVKGNIFTSQYNPQLFILANTSATMTDTSNNLVCFGDPDTWQNRVGFVDWENQNFSILEGSPAHDNGFDYSGWSFDIDSIPTPQGNARDIGACEFPEGGQSNLPPNIDNQIFEIDENTSINQLVGTVEATDPDAGQQLTFSIQGGNTGGAFSINSNNGELTVANSNALDFESNPEFSLTIEVEDNGPGTLTDEAIITVNLNDVNEVPEIEDQEFSIEDNIGNGELVGTVEAADPDAGQALTYAIISGNTDNVFTIDVNTGDLTILDNSSLNVNVTPEYLLTVEVTDDGATPLSAEAEVTVNLFEVNIAPNIDDQDFDVDENTGGGEEVGVVVASDPNAGQNITFSITSGNSGDAFQIGTASGILTIANEDMIDFEVNPVFLLTVKVEDDGVGNLSDEATVTININDVNEVPVISDQEFSIEETIGNGELVGIVEATDPDAGQSLTFAIIDGNNDGAFAMDASTGELTIADNSVLNIGITPVYNLEVEVTDDGPGNLNAQASITVQLVEVNFAPSIENQDFDLDENSGNGALVGTVIASDPNAGQTLTYTILSGNSGGAFEIGSTSGELTIANENMINFEENPVFILNVEVEDNGAGNLTDDATVTINLNDVNEPPSMEDQNFIVEPTIGNGELVGVVEALDPDQGQTLTYSITGGNEDGAFGLDPLSGELTIVDHTALNFVQTPIYLLDIEVQDDGQGNLTDDAIIAVSTEEINQAPSIENQEFFVDENSANGTEIGVIEATDPDAGQTLTFSIISGNVNDVFSMDESTGLLSVNNSSMLNFEDHQSFDLVVKVEDDGIGSLSDEATITIQLNDVNEAPVVETLTFNLDENNPEGTEVGEAEATDPDNGQSLIYSIISGNLDQAFSIDETTGMVTVNNPEAINFELYPVFYLVIEAEDNGAGNLTGQGVITINLDDVNETPQMDDQYFALEEFSSNGTNVGQVIAEDPDNGQTLTYSILAGNTQDAFYLDPLSGEITVQNSDALDPMINPVFILLIEVQDDGPGNLTDEASVVIAIAGPTGVGDGFQSASFECSVYPNPVVSSLTLDVQNAVGDDVDVKIVDEQGKVIYEENLEETTPVFQRTLNVSHWNKGMYFAIVVFGDQVLRKKILKY